VTPTFSLVATSSTCGSKPTAAMGFSIDNGSTTIEPTSFTATVNASPGTHVLHVKCWGPGTSGQTPLNIHVAAGGTSSNPPTAADITVASPATGANVGTSFNVVASSSTCGGVRTVSMGYSIDYGNAVIEPTSFSAVAKASPGQHVLHVKCWGQGTNNQSELPINVGSSGSSGSSGSLGTVATPQFSLPAGTYNTAQTVSLYEATAGSTIYYTTDGSAPSVASQRYSGPIAINASTVVEAMATAPGYTDSGMARASYLLVPVAVSPGSGGAPIPANALHIDMIQAMSGWRTKHDPATGGSATGVMSMTGAPSLSGETAKFDTSYSSYGGVLYSVTYGKDSQPTNFVYDAHVWIASGSQIGNLEMDNNQVVSNGDTIIYAFQCAGDTGTWDYSENAGTRANPVVRWVKSNQPCNPQDWAKDTWHHVQIWTSRDSVGNVTYHSVWLDGVEAPINKTVMSAFSLRWAGADMIANFQVDGGKSGGSSTLYLDNFTLYRW